MGPKDRNLAREDRLRDAVTAMGSYVTNLLALDGVVLAVSLGALPKKFSSNFEIAAASGAGLSLLVSIASCFVGLASQVVMLTGAEPLHPRGSRLEMSALCAFCSLMLGLVGIAWYALLAA